MLAFGEDGGTAGGQSKHHHAPSCLPTTNQLCKGQPSCICPLPPPHPRQTPSLIRSWSRTNRKSEMRNPRPSDPTFPHALDGGCHESWWRPFSSSKRRRRCGTAGSDEIASSRRWTGSRDNQLSFTVCHEIINLHLASAWTTPDGLREREEMQNSEAGGNLSLFAPLCPRLHQLRGRICCCYLQTGSS